MTSATRHIISEAVLWLAIFVIALVAFFYLDDRISAYLAEKPSNQSEASEQSSGTAAENASNSQQNTTGNQQEDAGYGRVVLHAGRSGHFEVKAYINNNSINLMADTGATYVVLTYEDADTLGLADNLNYSASARTANGVSKVAPIMLDSVEVGDIQVDKVRAFVAEEGKLNRSLLGMSFIGRLESFQMSGSELILVQ